MPIGAFFPSQIGGPCNSVYWHACELKKKGFEVEILTTTIGIKENTVVTNEFFESDCGQVYYNDSKNQINFNQIRLLYKSIKKAEIIHLSSLFNILSIISICLIFLFFRNKKVFWSARGELSTNALKFNFLPKKMVLFLYKAVTRKVVFHSTSEEETIDIKRHFSKNKIVQLPNYLYPSERELNSVVKNQIVYMGRIHPIKALDKIILGLSQSKKFINSDFKFYIAGKHEDRHSDYFEYLKSIILENQLEFKVIFTGFKKDIEKEKLYANSYATLLLSESENFGNVVVESLNQGTPVIASKGTPWKILESQNCGFFISNTPEEIANSINKLLTLNQEDYLVMRKNAYKLVDNFFDIRNQIQNWTTIYNSSENK